MSEMSYRENRYKKINFFLLLLIVPITGYVTLSALLRTDNYAVFQSVLALFMYSFPAIISYVLNFPIPQDCRLLYYGFTFCTVVIGSALYGYSAIPYWDKIFHFFSGILISAAGLICCHLLFHTLSGGMRVRRTLYVLFSFLFNLSVAALWEVYEYMLYIFLGIDAVNTLTSGVNDTMQDIMVCILGGLLFISTLLRAFYRGKNGFLLNTCAHFFYLRGQVMKL